MFTKLLKSSRFALLCALPLLSAGLLAQTTINVGPGQAYTTIQSGIDAASNGDTVLVAPGTYNENIDFKGKAITVTSSGGAAVTVIDGGSRGPAVTFKSGETAAAVISGFTIQHGGDFGNSELPGNGNLYISNSTPTIRNNTITLGDCWGIESNESAPLIQDNTISATQDHGDCSFGGGAAIIVWGGINGYNQTGVNSGRIIGNTIENNVESGLEDAGGNGGAGIAVWGGTLLIMGNIIRNNASPGGSGGAINFVSSEGTIIAQNLIYGNSAGCGGGAIATDGQGEYIVNNTIVDNSGERDAGYSECANIAQIYPSPDSYGTDNPRDIFINNIISGSTSYPAVNCSWFDGSPSEAIQPTFENNILYNAGGPFFGSYCVDVSGKYNNVSADPQFVNPAAGDYHLKSTSPAIDTGQNGVQQTFLAMTGQNFSNDFDGKARVQDATGKGCIIDIGAYEYPGSVSTCGLAVTETLTSSLNPAVAGQSVTFTAQLTSASGTPTGNIQFFDGANLLSTQTVSAAGTATFTTSSLTVGSHTITANYQPTGTFDPSSASLIQVIEGNPTSTTLTCLPNPIDISKTALFTATVTSASGTPTGTVSFSDDGTPLATTALAGNIVNFTYTGSVAGTHTIVATYVPSGSFAASSATCSEVVDALPTTSTLTVAPGTAPYGSSVTLTATVTPVTPPGAGVPTGTVTFYNGASAIGAGTLAGGVTTLSTASLPAGSYNLTCMYGGSSVYSTSSCNPVGVLITAAPTSISLSGSPNPGNVNQSITFNANVSSQSGPVGSGNVTFYDGVTSLGSSPLSAAGSASFTASFTSAGTHNITAVYDGSTDFSTSTSAVFKETIVAGDFSIAVLPGAASTYTGQAVAVKVSITSLQGFDQPLTLSCSGLPEDVTCNFNSATLPQGQGGSDLVIQTAAPQNEAAAPAGVISIIAFLLLPGWKRRRRFLARLCVLLLVIYAGAGMSGCGSVNSIAGGTPSGTYQIAVTATTSGPGPVIAHSSVVTLRVKSLF